MAPIPNYHQLSLDERDHIAVYRAQGLSLCEIGRRLKRNKGTISREVRRNKAPIYDAYGACHAQKQAKKRKHEAGQRPRLKNAVIRAYVKRHLRLGWSPEQIAGRMHQRHPSLSICVESIYRYIYDHKTRCQENFVPYLVRAHRRRLLRGHRHTHRVPHIQTNLNLGASKRCQCPPTIWSLGERHGDRPQQPRCLKCDRRTHIAPDKNTQASASNCQAFTFSTHTIAVSLSSLRASNDYLRQRSGKC